MKAKWILLGCVLAVACLGGSVLAAEVQTKNSATAHVFVNVDPTIAVGIPEPHVSLGSVGVGMVTGTITFRVDANTEKVKMQVEATNLCKGDQPKPINGLPLYEIPIDVPSGAYVDPNSAGPLGGLSKKLAWQSQNVDTAGWKWRTSEERTFDSSQNGHFSQEVDVTVQWDQTDNELPMGEYSGFVKLVAQIVMPG